MQNNVPMPTVLEEIVNTRRSRIQEISARISHINPLQLPRSTKSLFQALGGSINGEQRRVVKLIPTHPPEHRTLLWNANLHHHH